MNNTPIIVQVKRGFFQEKNVTAKVAFKGAFSFLKWEFLVPQGYCKAGWKMDLVLKEVENVAGNVSPPMKLQAPNVVLV